MQVEKGEIWSSERGCRVDVGKSLPAGFLSVHFCSPDLEVDRAVRRCAKVGDLVAEHIFGAATPEELCRDGRELEKGHVVG